MKAVYYSKGTANPRLQLTAARLRFRLNVKSSGGAAAAEASR